MQKGCWKANWIEELGGHADCCIQHYPEAETRPESFSIMLTSVQLTYKRI